MMLNELLGSNGADSAGGFTAQWENAFRFRVEIKED